MVYQSYLAQAIERRVAVPAALQQKLAVNLTVFAARSADGTRLVLRVLNANNVSVAMRARLQQKPATRRAAATSALAALPLSAAVQVLASPLFGTAAFDEEGGGWNSPQHPTFIATRNTTWTNTSAPFTVAPMSFAVISFAMRPAQPLRPPALHHAFQTNK